MFSAFIPLLHQILLPWAHQTLGDGHSASFTLLSDFYGIEEGWILFISVAQPCPTLCNPMDCSSRDFPVHHQLLELAQTQFIKSVIPSNHLIPCHPLLLLPSIFPSIRVFSNESVLHIRWPKYWEFQLQHQSLQCIFRTDFL